MGLAAPGCVGSYFPNQGWSPRPYIGRRILNHWTTGEEPIHSFIFPCVQGLTMLIRSAAMTECNHSQFLPGLLHCFPWTVLSQKDLAYTSASVPGPIQGQILDQTPLA